MSLSQIFSVYELQSNMSIYEWESLKYEFMQLLNDNKPCEAENLFNDAINNMESEK